MGFCRGLAGLILFNLSEARIGLLHVTTAIIKQAVKRSWIFKSIQQLERQTCFFLRKKVSAILNYGEPSWNLPTSPEFTSYKSNVNPLMLVHQRPFTPAKCPVENFLMSKHPTFAERKMIWYNPSAPGGKFWFQRIIYCRRALIINYSGTCISYFRIPAELLDSDTHSYFGGKSAFVLLFF